MYLPSVICEMNERRVFGSKASEIPVPRIFASVASIAKPVEIAHVSAVRPANFLKRFALWSNLPSISNKKNPIARSRPIVVMPEARDKNLLIASKFIAR